MLWRGILSPRLFLKEQKNSPFGLFFLKKMKKKNFKSVLIGGVVPQMITNYTIII